MRRWRRPAPARRGAGFAVVVVAEEVGTLARRSAGAAHETASKIRVAIERSRQGRAYGDKVTARLQDIAGQVQRLDQVLTEIAKASCEQNEGVSQVTTAVADMGASTCANTMTAELIASAARELANDANRIEEEVSGLRARIHGERQPVVAEVGADRRPSRGATWSAPSGSADVADDANVELFA